MLHFHGSGVKSVVEISEWVKSQVLTFQQAYTYMACTQQSLKSVFVNILVRVG